MQLGGNQAVGLGEFSHYWLGDFVMLWRPANSPVKPLSTGMRGAEVRWLRQSLDQLRGMKIDAQASDVFDADLAAQVRDFQRQHQLAVDGIAGLQHRSRSPARWPARAHRSCRPRTPIREGDRCRSSSTH